MKIGFYPRYDRLGASSRYRFFMFFDRWLEQGGGSDNIAVYPGMSDKYLQDLYRKGSVGKMRQLREFMRLYFRSKHLAENLIIEYELVPRLSFDQEMRLIGNRKFILNFDDNVWEKYRGDPRLHDKFDRLCQAASGVIVANRFLEEKVRQFNNNVCLIPTVLDLDLYRQDPDRKFEKFTVVWIGTPVTYTYLEAHLEALQLMFGNDDCRLLIIADEALKHKRPLAGVNAEYVSWSAKNETELLAASHVGIMPLLDDEFSRGKSSFKLLQYQASALPLIASPVGENNFVVEHNVNGFLADSPAAWQQSLLKLRNDKEFYRQCAENSRRRAYEYSLQKYFPVFQAFIKDTFQIF